MKIRTKIPATLFFPDENISIKFVYIEDVDVTTLENSMAIICLDVTEPEDTSMKTLEEFIKEIKGE